MKLRKYAVICYILALAMILPLGSMAVTPMNEQFVAPDYVEPYIDGLGNSSLSIEIDHITGERLNILITDARTGKVWETNPVYNSPDKASTTEDKKREMHSQLVVTYTFDKNGNAKNLADIGYMSSATTTSKFNSYEESVIKNQLKIEMILDNGELMDYYVDDTASEPVTNEIPAGRTVVGYKITYGLGDRNAALYPIMLTETRMNEHLARVQVLDENGVLDEAATEKMKDNILSKYRLTTYQGKLDEIERQVKRQKTESEKEKKRKEMEQALDEYVADYPIILEENIYELYTDAVSTSRNKKLLISYWASIPYTREDLELDHQLVGYTEESGGVGFTIPVEYVIEGNTFRATILTDEIDYPPEVGITRIDFLPAFAGADETVEDGYTFVPDGSGALMPINSEDQRQTGYQVAVMNRQKDEALTMNSMNLRDIPYYENTIMPVFGQKQDDNAYFCIIEEGYEFANIVAYVADNFTKFNTAFTSFFPIVTDEIYYASGTASGITMFPKVKVEEEKTVIERKRDKETNQLISKEVIEKVVSNYCRLPATDLSVRYAFLSDDAANYSGMAAYYRTYLMNTYGMDKVEAKEDMTYYADIYGIIDKKVSFAGFPFNTKYALTTFDEAEEIVQALFDNGVEDLKLRYVGIANGGLNQRYPGKFKVESNLGGKSGYKEFLEKMDALGVEVYPDIDMTHVYQDRMFDGFSPSNDTVMTLGKTQSIIYDFNLATGLKDSYGDAEYYHPRWVISPRKYEELFDKMEESLEEYGNKHISLGTLGYKLSSDYNEDMIIDRGQTARVIADQLRQYQEAGYDIIVEKGFIYTVPYASAILNIPLTSSGFTVADYDVPFVQMVLHGLVEYAGEPINLNQDVQYNILKCLEYGATVYGRFMYENDSVFQNTYFLNLFSLNYVNWMNETEEVYTAVNEAIADVQDQFIVNHECLAKNVFRTTYENGKQVIVNYNTFDYVDEELGITVGARDYWITGGAN